MQKNRQKQIQQQMGCCRRVDCRRRIAEQLQLSVTNSGQQVAETVPPGETSPLAVSAQHNYEHHATFSWTQSARRAIEVLLCTHPI